MAGRPHLLSPLRGSGAGLWASATQAAGITVSALFQQQVLRKRDTIALEGSGRALTYAELGERVNRLVRALAAKGIRSGDRIALLSENRLEYPELQLAAARLGAILACQN
jgi:acyl-CoA synthetase (AMP-forming)/AMP-acid ligase II